MTEKQKNDNKKVMLVQHAGDGQITILNKRLSNRKAFYADS